MLQTFSNKFWDETFSTIQQQVAVEKLEQGHLLFFPHLAFNLSEDEKCFLTPSFADPHAKNISYHPKLHKLWGVQQLTDKQRMKLKCLLDRFSHYAFRLVQHLLPSYTEHLIIARTSFRPIEICDRKTSYRKDDKRLHIDAFPSAPNQGKRILRVFCNINPQGEDRVWRVGEPFEKVAGKFLPRIKKPNMSAALLLRLFRITKSLRTPYDHYMLNLHDLMKSDEHYQQYADQQEVRFSPGSAWIVQTDHVSHAAMRGQFVLEQTFYLPVQAMQNAAHSPLRILEKHLQQPLV